MKFLLLNSSTYKVLSFPKKIKKVRTSYIGSNKV